MARPPPPPLPPPPPPRSLAAPEQRSGAAEPGRAANPSPAPPCPASRRPESRGITETAAPGLGSLHRTMDALFLKTI
ncbi:vasodilator-stimulated phosphoprotein-like [Cuculus canorus]|uniref:vasodilator-stimulated phosphoprotein-like n=1 Tax=Cuculus canorus TaxID=55661 RepID=UPI0023AA9409|nr:vasodilator-stimulated phosphoprotein-like [Cuculus canorus]